MKDYVKIIPLKNMINLLNYQYYVLGRPAIKNKDYDLLLEELLRLDPEVEIIKSRHQRDYPLRFYAYK